MPLKVIIIDDEPNAREKLQLMTERYCKDVQVAALAKDAEEGLAAIKEHQPDLIFLDIEMPVLTGFDMLQQIPEIIFANKQKIVSTRTLKEYEEMLDDSGFIRIHHSWLINKAYVKQYIKGEGGQVIMNDGTSLDVSRRKKDYVIEKLKN